MERTPTLSTARQNDIDFVTSRQDLRFLWLKAPLVNTHIVDLTVKMRCAASTTDEKRVAALHGLNHVVIIDM